MPLGPDEPMFLPKGNTTVLAPRSKVKTGSTFEIMQKGLEIIIKQNSRFTTQNFMVFANNPL